MMKRQIKTLLLLACLAGASSCFKDNFPKVTAPDDVAGDSVTTAPEQANVQRKVLIIGIDGCWGKALEKADAPNIHGLLPHSIYSFDALTQPPTWSAPGWSSMLNGVWSDKHGVKDNSFSGSNYLQYPMFFKYVKKINPQMRTVSICSWDPLNDKLITNADVKINTNENDIATKDSAIAHLKNDNPDIMFLHFDDVDHAGHQFGFDTTVTEYMQAINRVDGYVGAVLQALNDRPDIDKEDWLIVLSTDHGGTLSGHGGTSYNEKNIFTIFYNKNFTSRKIIPPVSTLKSVLFTDVDQYGWVKKDPSDDNFLNFNNYDGFTIQLQVQSSGLSADDPLLTNKDWNSGRNIGWVIAVDGQSWKFNAGDGSDRIDIDAAAPDLSDSKWHSIAVTVDKTGDVKLYQDDSLYTYTSTNGKINNWMTSSDVRLATGDDITGNYRNSWGISKFLIANIRVWDTIISEDDLTKNVHPCDTIITPDNPYFNNLVGFWRGTDGKGDILKDAGPFSNDMELHDSPSWIEQQLDFCNNTLPPSVPTIVDIVPTIFDWLHIRTDSGWGLDGISWLP